MKHGYFIIIFLNISLIFSSFSCSKTQESNEITLEIIYNGALTYENTQLTAIICSENPWNLQMIYETTGENWCTLSKNSGSTSENITLNIDYNSWQRERSAEIRLESGSLSTSLTLTQGKWTATSSENPEKVEIMTSRPTWMELPKIEDYPNSAVVSHDTYIYNSEVRNFTMLYDTVNFIAHWVAYPMSPIYIGIEERTDEWAYDPKIPHTYQPKLTSSFADSNYDRGHILASASRTANYQTNTQTFYFSNMTAQHYYLNRYYISSLESDLRNWADSADTLYVVTGVSLDGSFTQDIEGKNIALPKNYFYVVLSLKDGEYNSIGFWFNNQKMTTTDNPFLDYAKSVSEIEDLTGFEFFTNLSDKSVKQKIELNKWPF